VGVAEQDVKFDDVIDTSSEGDAVIDTAPPFSLPVFTHDVMFPDNRVTEKYNEEDEDKTQDWFTTPLIPLMLHDERENEGASVLDVCGGGGGGGEEKKKRDLEFIVIFSNTLEDKDKVPCEVNRTPK
jgi:hypothetical protein